jgi:hypothetical protein
MALTQRAHLSLYVAMAADFEAAWNALGKEDPSLHPKQRRRTLIAASLLIAAILPNRFRAAFVHCGLSL